jgi:hypothetical protein
MGIMPLDWHGFGGTGNPGYAKRFACKWQRKFSALFDCCDGKVRATGGYKAAATEIEWPGNDDVIIYNPLLLPWSPIPHGYSLYELVIDALGKFLPSPFEDNYFNPEEKHQLELMCPLPNNGTPNTVTDEPVVPRC